MRKALMCILAAGIFVGSYATDARVVSMGRHDAFFMDEVSIFRNPANISIYPNMVYGSFGWFMHDSALDGSSKDYAAMSKSNRDAVDPFFGAVISYSLDQDTEGGSQYPMLSLGAMFNRRDEMLDYVLPGTSKYLGSKGYKILEPLGRVDLLAGYVLKNGGMLGVGAYVAHQKLEYDGDIQQTSIFKGNLGLNWPVAKSMDLEVSLTGGSMTAVGDSAGHLEVFADHDYFGKVELRLFSALAALNGDFVPHVKAEMMEFDRDEMMKFDIAAGVGLNLNIDKGFFWGGIEFLYGQKDSSNICAREHVGGRVSFGIERNIFWDWLVIRVGGQKQLVYVTEANRKGYLEENPAYTKPTSSISDSDNDLVGLGFGINVENRLRIDFVAAEDLAYTFTNLFSAPQHHLFNRVSATYSF
ncbi:MAG: hypothetical protein GX556_03020 [Fibrobacter sp.]|nr:hypothetical protein [Fibrobacter sp.]